MTRGGKDRPSGHYCLATVLPSLTHFAVLGRPRGLFGAGPATCPAAALRGLPHSLRVTTATLLRAVGVDIMKVKDLPGHRHVTTTQVYDKTRIAASQSASHEVPI